MALGVFSPWPLTVLGNNRPDSNLAVVADLDSALGPAESEDRTRIGLVACGSAGIAMCRSIDKGTYGLDAIIALDTNSRALHSMANVDHRLLIKSEQGQKPQTQSQVDKSIRRSREKVEQLLGQLHAVILVSGLGGIAGTSSILAVAEVAHNLGISAFSFVTTPFEFECLSRHSISQMGLHRLRQLTENLLLVQDKPGDMVRHERLLGNVIEERHTALRHYLWNTCGCVTHYGMVGLEFEDIKIALNQRQSGLISRIGWGEAVGTDRAKVATLNALEHLNLLPLEASPSRSISVSIRARHSLLKMREVNTVMKTIKTLCPDDETLIIFSAGYDESLAERIQVSIVLT